MKITLTIISLLFFNLKTFSQKEIVYQAIKMIKLDEKNKEKSLTKLEKKAVEKTIKELKFYVTEFEKEAFVKTSPNSKNSLRLKKISSFINTREYILNEKYISWKIKITSYPISNELRVEVKNLSKDSKEKGTGIITAKEI